MDPIRARSQFRTFADACLGPLFHFESMHSALQGLSRNLRSDVHHAEAWMRYWIWAACATSVGLTIVRTECLQDLQTRSMVNLSLFAPDNVQSLALCTDGFQNIHVSRFRFWKLRIQSSQKEAKKLKRSLVGV